MEIAQTLFVKPAVEADSAFMARISNGELLLALFGQNAFSEDVRERLLLPSAHDFRALTVIGELLKATRGSEFGSGMSAPKSAEEVRRWADTMWALAREIPDSSYSPYAAYYAGCCYAVLGLERAREVERAQREGGVPKGNVTQFQRRSAAFREDATSTAAREAFLFANERGDAYLKPRAIYQRAVISLWLDRREEMNNLLDAALTEAPGEQTIREWVITLRNDKLLDKLEAESNNP
jgi:hypothetical protein